MKLNMNYERNFNRHFEWHMASRGLYGMAKPKKMHIQKARKEEAAETETEKEVQKEAQKEAEKKVKKVSIWDVTVKTKPVRRPDRDCDPKDGEESEGNGKSEAKGRGTAKGRGAAEGGDTAKGRGAAEGGDTAKGRDTASREDMTDVQERNRIADPGGSVRMAVKDPERLREAVILNEVLGDPVSRKRRRRRLQR